MKVASSSLKLALLVELKQQQDKKKSRLMLTKKETIGQRFAIWHLLAIIQNYRNLRRCKVLNRSAQKKIVF